VNAATSGHPEVDVDAAANLAEGWSTSPVQGNSSGIGDALPSSRPDPVTG
jgi:hypothetical protein